MGRRTEVDYVHNEAELNPDVVISSAGALVKYRETYMYKTELTKAEKNSIQKAREICKEKYYV